MTFPRYIAGNGQIYNVQAYELNTKFQYHWHNSNTWYPYSSNITSIV